MTRSAMAGVFVGAVLVLGGFTARPVAGVGIEAALVTADTTVGFSAPFQIQFVVSQAGDAFNGYIADFIYDSSRLTFVPVPVGDQEGSLMTSACASRFHVFDDAQAGSLSVSHVVLCSGVKMNGPEKLYVLNFQAGTTAGTTVISLGLGGTEFYDAGSQVLPLQLTDVTIDISPTSAIGADSNPRLHVRAVPNPFSPQSRLRYGVPRSSHVRLTIHDPRGRLVSTLVDRSHDSGEYSVSWNGRDSRGARMSSGVYFMRLEAAGQVRKKSVVFLNARGR